MVDVKVVDSGGLSSDFFSGIFDGARLNHRPDLDITDNFEGHTITSFAASAFVNKTYHINFDVDGDDIFINNSSITGTMNKLKVSDQTGQVKFKILGLDLTFGEIPTESSVILKGDDNIEGSEGSNYLNGYAGNDDMSGGKGRDTLDGGDGNDRLDGSRGEDSMHGGNGDDVLRGGSGRDLMWGDAGHDTFRFNKAGGVINNKPDIIVDFTLGTDRIALDADYFSGLGPGGTLAPDKFVSGGQPTTGGSHIIWDSGRLFYDKDGSGPKDEKTIAIVSAHLTSDHILLV